MPTLEETIEQEVFRFFEKWKNQMKVAMVIASIHAAVDVDYPEITHQMVADRIGVLVADGKLKSFGDIAKWRRSEICTAERG